MKKKKSIFHVKKILRNFPSPLEPYATRQKSLLYVILLDTGDIAANKRQWPDNAAFLLPSLSLFRLICFYHFEQYIIAVANLPRFSDLRLFDSRTDVQLICDVCYNCGYIVCSFRAVICSYNVMPYGTAQSIHTVYIQFSDFLLIRCMVPTVSYYAALLPRRGPHIASHSVCLSVRPSVRPSRYHYRASRGAT